MGVVSVKMAVSLKDRVQGSLLGLAVGDAVGTTVEFMPPGSFDKVTDMQGGGKFSLQPGQVRKSRPFLVMLGYYGEYCFDFSGLMTLVWLCALQRV